MSKGLHVGAALALVAGSLLPLHAEQRPVRRDLLVAAAASLSGLAPQLTQAFHDAHGIDIRFNFAASNTLARQIVEGARVNVFISADEAQMDLVEQVGRVVAGSRVNLLGNQLKIVTNMPKRGPPVVFTPPDLLGPNVRRVAMGDPAAVPVGVYARQWLQDLGLWSGVAPKVVPLPSSPAVLAAVREGRAEVGIVYVTDDRQSSGAYIVPIAETPRIVYPAAVIIGARQVEAQLFVKFLQKPIARRIFQDAGFIHLP